MIKGLEDIKTPTQYDLPAIIALDIAVMDGIIDFVGESDSNLAAGAFYLAEILLLIGVLILAVFGDEMDFHFIGIALYGSHHLHEFHQIAALVEGADKGVFDLDPLGALQIPGKQSVIGDPGLVILDGDVLRC